MRVVLDLLAWLEFVLLAREEGRFLRGGVLLPDASGTKCGTLVLAYTCLGHGTFEVKVA